jgi:hypothetical protein
MLVAELQITKMFINNFSVNNSPFDRTLYCLTASVIGFPARRPATVF